MTEGDRRFAHPSTAPRRASVAADHHGLPTPRSTLRNDSGAQVLVWCKRCQHQAEAPLQMLVDTGRPWRVPLRGAVTLSTHA